MRHCLGLSLFLLLAGIALFGVGLARSDTNFIAPGIVVLAISFLLGAAVIGLCTRQEEPHVLSTGSSVVVQTSTNPTMKKNKSDTNLELMSSMDEENTERV